MEVLTCKRCGELFPGRRSRSYCSPRCRRIIERRRRAWDIRAQFVRRCEETASMPDKTPLQRETWRRHAEQARAKLGGPRP